MKSILALHAFKHIVIQWIEKAKQKVGILIESLEVAHDNQLGPALEISGKLVVVTLISILYKGYLAIEIAFSSKSFFWVATYVAFLTKVFYNQHFAKNDYRLTNKEK